MNEIDSVEDDKAYDELMDFKEHDIDKFLIGDHYKIDIDKLIALKNRLNGE